MAYKPKPSQTRHGQRVDNPEPELTDTAELRVLIRQATQDVNHDYGEAVSEVQRILEVHKDRWREYFAWKEKVAYDGQVKNVWRAIGFLVVLFGALMFILFTMIRELEKHANG